MPSNEPQDEKDKLFHCLRCEHDWDPRSGSGYGIDNPPKMCAHCGSAYWNRPRRNRLRETPKGQPLLGRALGRADAILRPPYLVGGLDG